MREPEESLREDIEGQKKKEEIQKTCKYCGKTFYSDNIQKEYCSPEHSENFRNEKKKKII